jgi:hypothetical protein
MPTDELVDANYMLVVKNVRKSQLEKLTKVLQEMQWPNGCAVDQFDGRRFNAPQHDGVTVISTAPTYAKPKRRR